MNQRNRQRGNGNGDDQPRGTLGTFAGVFTPSILTILGLILFLRMGYVVGSAGLMRSLLIILLANSISVLTSISLSAIATNLRVKRGGDYYVISRTLGVQYGGALGLVLFLAQSVSIAFYAIGFGEVLASLLGDGAAWWPQAIAAVAVACLFVLAWLGADWATRFQYLIMAVLFAGIAAFYAGALPAFDAGQLRENLAPAGDLPFWVIFAIFFPAVTGFTQGVSMSGDLKDPGRSLPRGTFLAVGISLLVYVSMAVVFAAARPGAQLVADDNGAMRGLAILPWMVDAGAIAATLSSALASFLGAPRILQSLAGDRVFPFLNVFAAGHGKSGNPRRGVLLSAAIAFATISLGRIDAIAPVVTMFFLISYGLLNYATYFEAQANSPSFRPRFRYFHAKLSLAGFLACLGMMLAIHPTAAVIAVILLFAVHQYLSRTVAVERWADADRSRRFQRVREDLFAISADLEHPRNWRPVILAFSDNPERRERILRFASWLEGRSGLCTIVRLVRGEGPRTARQRQEAFQELKSEIDRHKLPAFPRVIVAPDPEVAAPVLLQSHGLGPVRANTVLLNWFDRSAEYGAPGLRNYARYLRMGLRFGCNLVLLGAGPDDFSVVERTEEKRRRIDVWFRDDLTGRLSVLLAYLMTRTEGWGGASIRLIAALPDSRQREEFAEELRGMLDDARITAEPLIVDDPGHEAIVRESAAASVVFLPLRLTDEGPVSVYEGALDDLIRKLGVTALVLARQEIDLDAEPEEGKHAEIAGAVDAKARMEKASRKAEKEAARAADEAREAQEKLDDARSSGGSAEELTPLVNGARSAAEEAEAKKRRAAKARAKAEEAAREANSLTGEPDPETGKDPPDRKP
jgi:amino acid transporter